MIFYYNLDIFGITLRDSESYLSLFQLTSSARAGDGASLLLPGGNGRSASNSSLRPKGDRDTWLL